MMKGGVKMKNFIVSLFLIFGWSSSLVAQETVIPIPGVNCVYLPSTLVKPEIRARVTLDSENRGLVYAYFVRNQADSVENINTIIIEILGPSPVAWRSPTTGEWDGGLYESKKFFDWSEVSGGTEGQIKPGQTLSGFEFVAPGLPTIVRFWVQGFYPGWKNPWAPDQPIVFGGIKCETESDAEEAQGMEERGEIPHYSDPFYDSVQGKTVGPTAPPAIRTMEDLARFLGHVRDLKHEAARLGWIRPGGVVQALDQKLDALEAALRRGEGRTALNIGQALLNQVEGAACKEWSCPGQRPITSEGYALLRYNVEYVLEGVKRLMGGSRPSPP
jgi:hypothetical protein